MVHLDETVLEAWPNCSPSLNRIQVYHYFIHLDVKVEAVPSFSHSETYYRQRSVEVEVNRMLPQHDPRRRLKSSQVSIF